MIVLLLSWRPTWCRIGGHVLAVRGSWRGFLRAGGAAQSGRFCIAGNARSCQRYRTRSIPTR